MPVLAHGNEYREESPEPIIGPIICPKEKEEAMTQEQQQQRVFDVLFGAPPGVDDDDDDDGEDPLAYTDVG